MWHNIFNSIKTYNRLGICFVTSLLYFYSCSSKNNLHLEKVTQSSDILKCNKVFSDSRKSIIELNEILVQTGVIDTSEVSSPPAAVIHAQGQEIILNLVKISKTENNFNELYAGKGYQLQLDYSAKQYQNRTEYVGHCEVSYQKLHSKFDIEGMDNTL